MSGSGSDNAAGYAYQNVHIDGSAKALLRDTYDLEVKQSSAPITTKIHVPPSKLEQAQARPS
jgi:hypothetical protein